MTTSLHVKTIYIYILEKETQKKKDKEKKYCSDFKRREEWKEERDCLVYEHTGMMLYFEILMLN